MTIIYNHRSKQLGQIKVNQLKHLHRTLFLFACLKNYFIMHLKKYSPLTVMILKGSIPKVKAHKFSAKSQIGLACRTDSFH